MVSQELVGQRTCMGELLLLSKYYILPAVLCIYTSMHTAVACMYMYYMYMYIITQLLLQPPSLSSICYILTFYRDSVLLVVEGVQEGPRQLHNLLLLRQAKVINHIVEGGEIVIHSLIFPIQQLCLLLIIVLHPFPCLTAATVSVIIKIAVLTVVMVLTVGVMREVS